MKVVLEDDNKIIVFLNTQYIKDIDFSCKESLEEYFQELFLLFKSDYDLEIYGYYTIDVFIDSFYGVILFIEKEDLDYFDYYDHQIDMRINIRKDSIFLYELNDYFDLDTSILHKIEFYLYKNKLYGKIIQKLTFVEMGRLLEYSNIVYGDCVDKIFRFGQILEKKDFSLFSL